MEDIIKIPSRRIPWKKIGLNAALSTLGLTTTGVVTTNAINRSNTLDLVATIERAHWQEMANQDKLNEWKVATYKSYTPSGMKARQEEVNRQARLFAGRRGKAIKGLCNTNLDTIRDKEIKEYCLKEKAKSNA